MHSPLAYSSKDIIGFRTLCWELLLNHIILAKEARANRLYLKYAAICSYKHAPDRRARRLRYHWHPTLRSSTIARALLAALPPRPGSITRLPRLLKARKVNLHSSLCQAGGTVAEGLVDIPVLEMSLLNKSGQLDLSTLEGAAYGKQYTDE